ncbi:prepilin peptidase [Nodosilinea sp. E11]|uniref:prepilin peptidase n=1 Tax=Nodosilinea sp. E11 TaxID=3037479 RepID=UPI0029347F83|nr:prepilin peptidase [Nodosilinea sp. E11]WOD41267.1 prepilin peptidase [Nodosilinea sp. E11]
MDALITFALVFLFGSAVGSFLNVVIYRIPAGLSLLHPPSRCPKCHTRLKPYDNVPVLGWLWLKGRCRYCRAPISPRYPLIEALTGALFVAAFWLGGMTWATVGYWLLLSWLVALAFIDLDTLTLPNVLTQSGLVLGLAIKFALPMVQGAPWPSPIHSLLSGIVGAVLGIWIFDLITIFASAALGQTAMGGGDAKLAAMLGAWLGWQGVLLSGFLACVVGAVVGGGAIALKLISRRQPVPFGPFLAIAAVITLFWGEPLIGAYRAIFFP